MQVGICTPEMAVNSSEGVTCRPEKVLAKDSAPQASHDDDEVGKVFQAYHGVEGSVPQASHGGPVVEGRCIGKEVAVERRTCNRLRLVKAW